MSYHERTCPFILAFVLVIEIQRNERNDTSIPAGMCKRTAVLVLYDFRISHVSFFTCRFRRNEGPSVAPFLRYEVRTRCTSYETWPRTDVRNLNNYNCVYLVAERTRRNARMRSTRDNSILRRVQNARVCILSFISILPYTFVFNATWSS